MRIMTWQEALEQVVRETGHPRFRDLCADSWPDHEAYRVLVIRLATGQEPEAVVVVTPPQPQDADLQAYVAKHGCGGC